MPFDTFATAAVTDELSDAVTGGQVQRIIQSSASSVALAIYNHGELHWVVISADPRFARLHLASDRLAKAFPAPSPFTMLLRKHLESSRVAEIRQEPYERIVHFVFGQPETRLTLVAEIMGKHSNIIVLDTEFTILGALKNISPRQSRVRPIHPGLHYTAPPLQPRDGELFGPGPRIDPHLSSTEFEKLLRQLAPDTQLKTALQGLLPGASPFLVSQIALHAGTAAPAPLAETEIEVIVGAADQLYGRYADNDWEPYTFTNERNGLDFAPYRPIGVVNAQPAPSMSLAVERSLGTGENRDALAVTRRSVLERIEREMTAGRRRIESLRRGLAAAADAEQVMENGQLILSYQHTVQPRATELAIPELGRTIPLDVALSPAENADRAFHRYRKLRDARVRIPTLLEAAEAEVARLEDIAAFTRLAGSEGELRELERAIAPSRERAAPGRRREKRRGPVRYRYDGHTAIVGRNAAENEEVTFRLARREDTWLHARGRTGAHVILQTPEELPTDAVIEAAARLAAYFSEGRSDAAVDVDVTRARDVRKIAGGPPGRVTYRNERTLRVQPQISGWDSSG